MAHILEGIEPEGADIGMKVTVFALLAPCGPGASTASVRHRIYESGH